MTTFALRYQSIALKMYKVLTVVGARPQFIKAAALSRAINQEPRLQEVIVHSGQHYDHSLSGSFFQELDIPEPKYNLGIGSTSHNLQIAKFIERFDSILTDENPDVVVVYGDTNTTAAAAIATAKRNITLAHVEAGLREWNKAIPEEVNKLLTDAVTDLFFTPTVTGLDNLAASGVTQQVYHTGDISLDLLYGLETKYIDTPALRDQFGLPEQYVLMTCHRDRNTDIKEHLAAILTAVSSLEHTVLWPIHPRSRKAIEQHELQYLVGKNIVLTDPLPFWTTQSLLRSAALAITDSGGVIKEAYFHHVPTVIIDQQTEWLEAVSEGWAVVTGPDMEKILSAASTCSKPNIHTQALGNGTAGTQIVNHILRYLDQLTTHTV